MPSEKMRHLFTVPPTKEGMDLFRKHLEAGNQAIIVTYGKCMVLTKRSIGYVNLSNDGKAFLIGYGKRKTYLFAGYLKLVEAGYKI